MIDDLEIDTLLFGRESERPPLRCTDHWIEIKPDLLVRDSAVCPPHRYQLNCPESSMADGARMEITTGVCLRCGLEYRHEQRSWTSPRARVSTERGQQLSKDNRRLPAGSRFHGVYPVGHKWVSILSTTQGGRRRRLRMGPFLDDQEANEHYLAAYQRHVVEGILIPRK
jgi:hypothetical protein